SAGRLLAPAENEATSHSDRCRQKSFAHVFSRFRSAFGPSAGEEQFHYSLGSLPVQFAVRDPQMRHSIKTASAWSAVPFRQYPAPKRLHNRNRRTSSGLLARLVAAWWNRSSA